MRKTPYSAIIILLAHVVLNISLYYHRKIAFMDTGIPQSVRVTAQNKISTEVYHWMGKM
jgi:hypothetical protein